MDSYALHLAMAAMVGASFVAVSAYYVHRKTLTQLLEFARAVERERERSQNDNRNKNRALKEKGEVDGEAEEAAEMGIPPGLPKLHTAAAADEGSKKSGSANSNKLSGNFNRPSSPKSPGVSAFGSLEGSDDEDDTLQHDAHLDNSYLHTNRNLGPECKNSFKTFPDDIAANGDNKSLPSSSMIRSHSISGDLHGVQPDPVAADLLRKEREQETFVRMKISPSETPSADEAEVYRILQECLELRQSYVFKEDIPPWEKEVITDPSTPKPNLNPFAYDAEQKTEHSFKMVDGVVHVYTSQESMERIFPVADATTFFTDLHHILRVISAGNIRTLCHHRLNLLEQKFNFHLMLNADREFLAQKTAPHRDFYNVRKVDTHVHHSACMNQKHLLRLIKSKLRKEPDEVVIFRDGTYLTLKEVFESLDLTGYDLNVDLLDVHADKSTFHRFDKFNLKYNPCGQSRLREIFLKQDNLIQGLKYAGTKNGDAQELLYNYAIYFLNEIKHVSAASKNDLPKGLSEFVDRGTLEICLHLIVLSLSVVMAGSGHLQTFRLLRYLRGRSSAEGNINYGIQMAVSLAIGFLFLGGGTQTFATGNSAIAALLITLYPRFPTGPNDNRCHLQAFRHLYVIAAESRRLQTVDVDTGLPVYAPIEMTIKETDHYSETSFCEVTPCILPERSVLKSVRVCGPRYWPQVIHLVPEDKPWWRSGDKNDPFNGGLLYIKRKVGSCSYMDDPVGCQSLLSRAMHKIFDTSSSYNSAPRFGNSSDLGSFNVEQLVSAFSADPSLIAFSQLCCGSTWNSRSDSSFQDFCSQVLFECISKDRPALLQVYLSLYTIIGSMWEQVNNSQIVFYDSCFLSSLKLALAYNEALMSGKLTWAKGGIIQSTFLESIRKHLEEILERSLKLKGDLYNYLKFGEWPNGELVDSMLLAWYLQWYSVPPTHVVKSASEKIKGKVTSASSVVPLLHLLLPNTNIRALTEIDKFLCSPKC